MNGLKVVAVAAVVLVGVIWYEYMPVEAKAGVITVCNDSHHGDTDRQISSTVHSEPVPRCKAGRYTITQAQSVCSSCQAKIDEETRQARLEAERQERIAREAAERQAKVSGIASALDGRIYLGNRSQISVRQGQNFNFALAISNRGSRPLSFKVKIESDGRLELRQQKPVEKPFSPLGNEMARRWWRQWPKLIGEGLDVGESISGTMERRKALNPGESAHYTPQSFLWPYYQHYVEWGSGVEVALVGVDAGRDCGIRLYAVYEDEKILLTTATVSIKYE